MVCMTPSLTVAALHISHSSTLTGGTVDSSGVSSQGLCTGYFLPPITLYQLLPFNFSQLTATQPSTFNSGTTSIEVFLDGPRSTFYPIVLMSYCNCTLFMWWFLPWVSALCQVVSSMRGGTKLALLTTHLLATGKRFPRHTYYTSLLANSGSNETQERGFGDMEGLACPCWQEGWPGYVRSAPSSQGWHRVLSQGTPSPRHLLPWKKLSLLFSVGICDLLQVDLQVRGSGPKPRAPASTLYTLHTVSGCGSHLWEVFTDTSMTFQPGPESLHYLCNHAFVHLFGFHYFSPSWALVIRPYVHWDEVLLSNINLDKYSYFLARIKW